MKLYVFSFLLLFIVPSCLADETKPPVFSWENPTTLYFKGNVSKDNFRLMQEEMKKHKNSIETLIISSGGGETTGGLMFGNFVREHQINVVVRILCASSCANYVFTGAKSVYLEAGAIVGWHGGALQDTSDQIENFPEENKLMMRQSMADWCSAESAFFAAINKPQEMLIWGQLFSQQKNFSDEIQLWTYSLMDLQNLGFDVTAEDKEIAVMNETVGHIAAILPVTSELLSFSRSCKEALELTFN